MSNTTSATNPANTADLAIIANVAIRANFAAPPNIFRLSRLATFRHHFANRSLSNTTCIRKGFR